MGYGRSFSGGGREASHPYGGKGPGKGGGKKGGSFGKGGKKGGGANNQYDDREEPFHSEGKRGGGKGNDGKHSKGKDAGQKGGKKNGKAKVNGSADDSDEENGHEENGHEESSKRQRAAPKSGGSGAVTSSHLSSTTFASLDVSAGTKRAFSEGFGYEFMTEVQAASIGPMLAGTDVVARARTGTGKTLAFLVPVVEAIRSSPSGVGGCISALILSPTRELAAQIAEEARVILAYHQGLGVACFYGGTKINGDHNKLARQSVDILVATPGRMQDHLDNTKDFLDKIGGLKFLVLDEADQLLDMGFRDSILKILRSLPKPGSRQGALFSATFPNAVGEIAKLALRPKHVMLNTVKADEEVTPDQISQCVCTTDLEGMTELLWACLRSEMDRCKTSHKIMVFFVTARLTQFYAELFCAAGVEVLEIHSRKSQSHRTKSADKFRAASKAIMFSSDVSARGVDYPDVTSVIQVGVPASREQYIHRLGRTGRAGKSGNCTLLLHDFEQYFLKTVKDLPVKQVNKTSFVAPPPPDSLWTPPVWQTAGQAYQAWLGYYNSAKGLGWKKAHLVSEAARFAASIGACDEHGSPPPILAKTVGKMGLKGVPGLNVVAHLPYGE